jgi:hypothetical protein
MSIQNEVLKDITNLPTLVCKSALKTKPLQLKQSKKPYNLIHKQAQ